MVLEESLAKEGILGLWTIFNLALIWYLLKRLEAREDKLSIIIENNTKALTLCQERSGARCRI